MNLANTISGADYSRYACNVYLNGTMLPSYYQVVSVQIKQGYQYISSAQILIKQDVGFYEPIIPDPTTKPPLAGEQISIRANADGDEIILFDGFIVKHNYKNTIQGTRLQLTAKNIAVNMAMTTKTEVFANQNDKDIIETITQNNGLTLNTGTNITTAIEC